jgi:hypothetical protein
MPAASFLTLASFRSSSMRLIILTVGTALSLAACGNKDQSDNSSNVDENLAAENIVSNDVTAIDAVTADAANMAADVNYSAEMDNGLDNASNAAAPAATATPRPKPSSPVRTEPAVNTAASNSE